MEGGGKSEYLDCSGLLKVEDVSGYWIIPLLVVSSQTLGQIYVYLKVLRYFLQSICVCI